MIERTLEALPEHPEWFFQQTEDGIAFVDPLSGDSLSGMVWPPTLELDEISRTGRDYLQQCGHPLHVIYASHGGAEDFDNIIEQQGEHQRHLADASVMALELDWKPEYRDNLSHPDAPSLAEASRLRQNFLEREIAWGRSMGKLILPFDIDGPLDPLRRSLLRLVDADFDSSIIPLPDELPNEKRLDSLGHLSRVAYNIFRHPMMLGQLGVGLRQLIEQGKITQDDQTVVTIGGAHDPTFTDQATLLGYAGHITTSKIEPREPRTPAQKAALARWSRDIAKAEVAASDILLL